MNARNDTAVLTDPDAIVDALNNVEPGDELTIEDETGRRDNREVTDVKNTHIVFGDPVESSCRLLHRDRGTVHKMPQQSGGEVSTHGYNITRLWVWN